MSVTLEAPIAVREAPSTPDDETKTLSLQAAVQPVLNAIDRVARDFPDLFILASSS